jgi:hypothetical protein
MIFFSLRASSNISLPISRVAHSITYSAIKSDMLSRLSFFTNLSRKYLRSSVAAKVILSVFLPEKFNLSCTIHTLKNCIKIVNNRDREKTKFWLFLTAYAAGVKSLPRPFFVYASPKNERLDQ